MALTTISQLAELYKYKDAQMITFPYMGSLSAEWFNLQKIYALKFGGTDGSVMQNPASHTAGGTIYNNDSAGFIKHANISAGTYILGADMYTGSAHLNIQVFDRIWACSGIAVTTTATQTLTASPTFPRNPRDFKDLEFYVEVCTAVSSSAITLTIDYKNISNVSKQTIVSIPSNARAGAQYKIIPGGMAVADLKDVIKEITAVKLNTTGTTGEFGITVQRHLTDFGFVNRVPGGSMLPSQKLAYNDWRQIALPKLEQDACVSFVVFPRSSSCGPLDAVIYFGYET